MTNNIFSKIDTVKRANVHTYLEHLIPFNSGSCRGRLMVADGQYVVYSYDTVICRVCTKTREVLYFDNAEYSATTSFIQNQCRAVYFGKDE